MSRVENNKYMCNVKTDSCYLSSKDSKIISELKICDYETVRKNIESKNQYLVCIKGHQLVAVCKGDRKPHFRHKNADDYKSGRLSDWHYNWQLEFDETEKEFPKIEGSKKKRRADAVVGNYILEFQHSNISTSKVDGRKNDYSLYNKDILWVIDGNTGIDIVELTCNNTFLLQFNDTWKYDRFISYEYIYIDIQDRIYRIRPNDVKSNMLQVNEYKERNVFINEIINNTLVWNNTPLHQCILYHNQRGAGCGKTYESIQLLLDDKFKHVNTFIYLTKMHTAKEVIFNEFKEQYNGSKLSISEPKYDESGKQNKINYHNDITNEFCDIIIGTIDSFTYALHNKDKVPRGNDYFINIVKSISNGNNCVDKDGDIKYSGRKVKLSNKCLIIIDEAQDLSVEYLRALCEIMKSTYIDVYLIGDELQSIMEEDNIYVNLKKHGLPSTNIITSTGINKVRRFHNKQFIPLVNKIVSYKEFCLPEIKEICTNNNCGYKHNDNEKPYELFQVYNNKHNNYIKDTIKKILTRVDNEVSNNNYLPNNFMFITPVLTGNTLVKQLEIELQQYWIDKFSDSTYQNNVLKKSSYWKDKYNSSKYFKHAFLHKSDEGKSINLKESENSSRILSIHASKGNGCEVVFLLNFTEQKLRCHRTSPKELKYESLIHVAMTRQKLKLYIGLVYQHDDIFKRFMDFDISKDLSIPPDLSHITKSVKITGEKIFTNKYTFDLFDEKIIKPVNLKCPDIHTGVTKIIDMEHHFIRACVFNYYFMYNIIINEKIDDSKVDYTDQYLLILKKRSDSIITIYNCKEYYKVVRKLADNKTKNKTETEIPLLKYSKDEHSIYYKYYRILHDIIENIQQKIRKHLKKKKLPLLCPLECVILLYMKDIVNDGIFSEISIKNIYDIISIYDNGHRVDIEHNKFDCKCNSYFTNKQDSDIDLYNHYEQLNLINKLYKKYRLALSEIDNSEFKYNINHVVKYDGKNSDYKVWNKIPLIAYSNNYVVCFTLKPQLTKLNFNQVLFETIINNFLILNSMDKDYERYHNKKIITCILTLDSEEPVFFDYNIDKYQEEIKKIIYEYLLYEYENHHNTIFDFIKSCYNTTIRNKTSISSEIKKKISMYEKLPTYIASYFDQIRKNNDIIKKRKYIKNLLLNTGTKLKEELCTSLEYSLTDYFGFRNDDYDLDSDSDNEEI